MLLPWKIHKTIYDSVPFNLILKDSHDLCTDDSIKELIRKALQKIDR